uniref:Uncharacterized protein n=1 Tax=Haptolina brevifila TaxID=156173 RepID=A0A7S2BMS0_9EUKA
MAHWVPVQAPDCIAHAFVPAQVASQQPVSSATLAQWRSQADSDRAPSSVRQVAKSNPRSELIHQATCAQRNACDSHEESPELVRAGGARAPGMGEGRTNRRAAPRAPEE